MSTSAPETPSSQPDGSAAATATLQAPEISRERIPVSIDPFGSAGAAIASALTPFRTTAVTKIYLGLTQIQNNLGLITKALSAPLLPPQIIGALVQPDGSFAASVQIQFDPSTLSVSGPVTTVLTDDSGGFTLAMPSGATLPTSGLAIAVHGANANANVTIPMTQIAANGVVGKINLPNTLEPLPISILAALEALVPATTSATQTPSPTPTQLPGVTIGEDGSACSQSFKADATVDNFPYGVFFRLVEPQMSIVNQVTEVPIRDNFFVPLPNYTTSFDGASTTPSYTDRVPVEQPISVDGFLDEIAGVDTSGVFVSDETVPMAATLGLGYVLWFSQQWTFKGLGLGDLVYSLPLAPGEQTEVAVFERTDTAAVYESESFSEEQAMQQQALSDTSTFAVFNSAFNEAASGGSQFQTNSSSSSWGGTLILLSGGGGSSSSSGSSNEWLQGQRDSAQTAAETQQSSAENEASARRSAARTGMRLASATESQSVTTKTITNHNHTRALTMQYWEVLRVFDVTTAIDGLTLTCLVPLQIVRFMPPGQPQMITDASQLGTRSDILNRYANIIKHLDVLLKAVPRRYQYGLKLLQQFAGDPSATVDPEGGVAEDVIQFELTGSFLSCETISVVAVTNRNTRVGPVTLGPAVNGQPPELPPDTFTDKDSMLAWLLAQRQTSSCVLQGSLALPTSMNRSDIVGFEISRSWKTVSYTLLSQVVQTAQALQPFGNIFGEFGNVLQPAQVTITRSTVTITPSDLEPAVGGPNVFYFSASIEEFDANGNKLPAPPNETYANDPLFGTVLPLQPYPVPALQIAPVLRYSEILEIEKVAQHIVRNTTLYSKAVWMSLTPDERAILLDGYTIGVPSDGVADASQMVPLLNCVQNKVLGFFGNSMIMPFIIPQSVADSMNINPAQIVQALLAYQQASFVPPQSTIALPTQGVLGEGVLGHCPSAEKIDITRFWNWQDSPADTAPAISPVTLPTTSPSIAAGLTAPNSLTNLPSLINNVLQAPTPNTSLLQSMGTAAASEPDFSTALTGAAQLAPLMQNSQNLANQARQGALQTTQQLTGQAMATVGNIVGGMYGNPSAGSSAASAMTGAKSGSSSSTTTSTKSKTTQKSSGSGTQGSSTGGNGGTSGSASSSSSTPTDSDDTGIELV
jgi:uncharacterized membrane protein YgcG